MSRDDSMLSRAKRQFRHDRGNYCQINPRKCLGFVSHPPLLFIFLEWTSFFPRPSKNLSCYYHRRIIVSHQCKSILLQGLSHLTFAVTRKLMSAFVLFRWDFCNFSSISLTNFRELRIMPLVLSSVDDKKTNGLAVRFTRSPHYATIIFPTIPSIPD